LENLAADCVLQGPDDLILRVILHPATTREAQAKNPATGFKQLENPATNCVLQGLDDFILRVKPPPTSRIWISQVSRSLKDSPVDTNRRFFSGLI
jgi:hypothetical protein